MSIEILGEHGGCYFPICQLDLEALRAQGFSGQFMLRYSGQISQLTVAPSGPDTLTPHSSSPEQDLNMETGGNPDRTIFEDKETVTVLFATGHSKSDSDIAAPSLLPISATV